MKILSEEIGLTPEDIENEVKNMEEKELESKN